MGTPASRSWPATAARSSSRSSSSPLLVDLGDDPARRVAEAEADGEEVGRVATAGPEVDRAQFGATGQVGEVGSGPDPLDPLLGERLGDLGLARRSIRWRYFSTACSWR